MTVKFVLGLLVVLSASCSAQPGALRVYKGKLDSLNEFPFAVLLQMAESPFLRMCTGSLVAENWVLTAGHCIPEFPIIVKYGEYTLPASVSKSYTRVINTFIHPGFIANQDSVAANDVALILVEKVPDKKHAKLLALDYKSLFGLSVKYAGFGRTTRSIGQISVDQIIKNQLKPLKVGEGIVASCEKTAVTYKYGPAVCITPTCSKKKQQARQGDSGGPLVYNGRLIGVAMSINSVIPMAYYAPISPYLPWIKEVMQSN